MNDFYISIIIPVYNSQDYLFSAFSSLLQQSIGFEHLQVIFIDDCSTDDSFAIVTDFSSQYHNVTVLKTPKNSGQAGLPRNLGLEAAQAPYIMFLDSDDFFEVGACKLLYDEILSSGADLVGGYYRETDIHGNPTEERSRYCILQQDQTFDLPEQVVACTDSDLIFWCKIYKNELIKKYDLRFRTDTMSEDVLFLAEYTLRCCKVVYLDRLVHNYRIRQDANNSSVSHTYNYKHLADRSWGYQLLLACYQEHQATAAFDRECRFVLDGYLFLSYESPLTSPDEQLNLLKHWQWLAQYTLEKELFIRDEQEKFIFELVAQGKFEEAHLLCPGYLAYRSLKHENEIHKALAAERQTEVEELRRGIAQSSLEYEKLFKIYKDSVVEHNEKMELLAQLQTECHTLRHQIAVVTEEAQALQSSLASVLHSKSFKIGHALVTPFYKGKNAINRLK